MDKSRHSPNETDAAAREVVTNALVLRTRPYRESDLMAHLLTPSLGKISVLARHVRSSKKRFPSSLDVFDRGRATLTREKNGGWAVKTFTPSHTLIKLRSDLDKLSVASVVCESFDLLLQEHDAHDSSSLFEVLDLSLNAVDEAQTLADMLRPAFIAIQSICERCGIADASMTSPGTAGLNRLLDAVERYMERRLLSREALAQVLAAFRQKAVAG